MQQITRAESVIDEEEGLVSARASELPLAAAMSGTHFSSSGSVDFDVSTPSATPGRRANCKGHELFADRFISLDHCTVVRFERRRRRYLGAMLTDEQYAPYVHCLPAGEAHGRRSAQLWWQHSEQWLMWRYGQ
jgi:hypothetical protein